MKTSGLRCCAVLGAVFLLNGNGPRPVVVGASPVATLDVPGRVDADPWVAAAGSYVAVAWGASAGGKADVFVAVSRDGGLTFGPPVQVNAVAGEARLGGELPPRVALLSARGRNVPDIAVLWTARGSTTEIKTARSRDLGRTFSAPVTLQAAGAPGDRGWPAIAIDGDARLHAIWLDHRGMAANRTASAAAGAAQKPHVHDGVAMAQGSGLFYASLSSKAAPERQLTAGVCYCCKTALAAGPGGRLYAAWRHVYPGSFRDMAFTMSRDGGRTFSPPVRVSEDGWSINGCPDDGPALALDARGGVHVIWPTVLDGANPQGAIFYASTRDGRSFTPRVRVPTLGGPKPSHPQIVVDRAGRTFIAWDEIVDGRRVAAVREMRNASGTPAFGDAIVLSPNGPALYPVLAAGDRGVVAAWTTGGDTSRIEVRLVP